MYLGGEESSPLYRRTLIILILYTIDKLRCATHMTHLFFLMWKEEEEKGVDCGALSFLSSFLTCWFFYCLFFSKKRKKVCHVVHPN